MNPETIDDLAVSVTDGTNPVSQVEVAIGQITGTTGSQGGCTLHDVPVGTVTVTATKTGYVTYSQEVIITSSTETLEITLEPQ
ncbi:MAG: carboxypeptidase regulatory-like domain-containing protein [Methanobrevibacter millerae]|uniref:Carboxypeptidase regulatory-like domain-containing protein n=1 Tax=Methanobrevibacter millerae TaxID=230361 RepID=A0A8T3VLU0_9EURY|nr:carboxypeptidase regulatory-like domain-containing protein [Methanobrevibacter millerae]MBE6505640.1 carboxypeptidase regulatory-like domain-containing protein [Methanobrevibacter millerae]